MIFAYRPAQTQTKPTGVAAKATFVETPADGPNKENDQPAADSGRVSEADGQEAVAAAGGDKSRGSDGDDSAAATDADDDGAKIIPWRAKLRKTNSTLNLLE